ncbi:MAG: hypothetical protein KatS3mg068_1942 [Candidatus Sericytochromatia bacterium]|nr:MAG: hypothetical protein KatS3mg068_1942 [Candidatus Sericytochromatia bacterium]
MIKLLNGLEATVEGLLYTGVKFFYSSSAFPNNRLLLYALKRFREVNRICIQTNNDKETLGRFIGAGITGTKLSASNEALKIDLLNYPDFPALIIDISNEFNYLYNKFITIIPSNIQNIYNLTIEAFNISQYLKRIVILKIEKVFSDIYSDINISENILPIEKTYIEKLENSYSIYETYDTNDSEILIISYGFISEIIKENIKYLSQNKKIGLFKLITLNPLPLEEIKQLNYRNNKIIMVNIPFINSISEKIININEYDVNKVINEIKFVISNL